MRVVSLNAITETPDDSRSITGITMLNNFQFNSTESITCWRAYCIGRGKTVKPEKPSSSKYAHCNLELCSTCNGGLVVTLIIFDRISSFLSTHATRWGMAGNLESTLKASEVIVNHLWRDCRLPIHFPLIGICVILIN